MTEFSRESYAALERELEIRTAELSEARAYRIANDEVLQAINGSIGDAAPVFEKIVDSCDRLFTTDHAAVWLVREDGQLHLGAIRTRVLGRAPDVPMTLPLAEAVCGMPLRERRVVHLTTIATETTGSDGRILTKAELSLSDRAWVAAIGDHTLLVAPLRTENRDIGTIALVRRPPKPFSDKEITLLTTFANQAVIAIENVRLFNETKESLDYQTATSEVLRVISSSVADITPVFEKILDSCERLFSAEHFAVMLVGEDGLLQLPAYRGAAYRTLSGLFPMPIEGTIVELALAERQTVHYPDIGAVVDPPPIIRVARETLGNYSLLMAPLLLDGHGIGAIALGRNAPKAFTEKEIALLSTFADQSVIAIENARLFRETHEALERQTATAEVLKVISESPTDLQPVFDAITERAMALCGASCRHTEPTRGANAARGPGGRFDLGRAR
ncbi:MAG: GAF domain-containing protein [Gammaproteobacteria bacterium]|nr:GAF domain-containing protein [Gammaproteobacteria bacterium]